MGRGKADKEDQAFELLEPPLGGGGFADTYRARVLDPRLVRKWGADVVAIKIPKDKQKELVLIKELITTSLVTRALQKASEAANVVRYLDVELLDDRYVMVMEFVPGGSLRDLMGKLGRPRRPLPVDQCLQVAQGILKGLTVIHDAGIFHRDIKPENILLLNGKTPKIADLGIATLLQSNEQASTTVGTLAYMSPEILGSEGASFPSDIWSLGVTLYEMLTGQWPFGDEYTPMGPMVHLIVDVDPVPPHKHRPEIPEAVSAAVLKSLQKKPQDRYASPAEMSAALRASASGGRPVEQRAESGRIQPTVRSDESVSVNLVEELKRVRPMLQERESMAEAERILKALAGKFPKDPRPHRYLGELYNRSMQYADAIAAFKEGLRRDPQNAQLHWDLALVYKQTGKHAEAIFFLETAIELGLEGALRTVASNLLKNLRGSH